MKTHLMIASAIALVGLSSMFNAEAAEHALSTQLPQGPRLMGYSPWGESGGYFYVQVFFEVDSGYTCEGLKNAEAVYFNSVGAIVSITPESSARKLFESYAGVSWLPNVCQVNLAAPVGTKATLLFNYDWFTSDEDIWTALPVNGAVEINFSE